LQEGRGEVSEETNLTSTTETWRIARIAGVAKESKLKISFSKQGAISAIFGISGNAR
jgi:hypothetical protein